jgi:hypothetical protein
MAAKSGKASAAQGPVLDWLLEENDPAVRLYALTRLCGEAADSPSAAKARKALMKSGPAAEILALQGPEGFWGEGPDFYRNKYGGTTWQVLMLAELGAEGSDKRIRAACEYLFAHSWEPESGGFSADPAASGGGRPGMVIPCLTGNMARGLIDLGFGADERVAKAVEWIARWQRADDGGAREPSGGPYDRLTTCFGDHSCFMGVVKSLKALAAVPPKERSKAVKAKIAVLVEFVLVHRVHKKSHDLSMVSKPGWLKFGFPLMYQTDALEMLCILAELGLRDERASDAADAVEAARGADGRWRMANSFNGKTLVDIERKGEASKWITARALYALACQGRA